jgi:hypothetical protein
LRGNALKENHHAKYCSDHAGFINDLAGFITVICHLTHCQKAGELSIEFKGYIKPTYSDAPKY